MRNCFIPGCDQKSKHIGRRSTFVVPKNEVLLAKWIAVLPKLRPLKAHDRICSLHFLPHEVDTHFEHIIKGKIYQLERDRVRLKPNVVPSQNLPTDEEILLLSQTRKQGIVQADSTATQQPECELLEPIQELVVSEEVVTTTDTVQTISKCITNQSDDIAEEHYHLPYVVEDASDVTSAIETVHKLFHNLYDEIFEVVLPNTLWGIHRCPERSIIVFSYLDTRWMQPTKMLTINAFGVVQMFLAARQVNTLDFLKDMPTTENVSNILTQLDEIVICVGATSQRDCEVVIPIEHCTTTHTKRCNHCASMSDKSEATIYEIDEIN